MRESHLTTLKGGLLALEATTATTETTTSATAATTTATEVTAATATTATATETTTATATATTAAATEATTTATVVVTGLGVVKTDGTTLEVGAVQLIESVLGILNGVEGNIGEALGTAGLPRRRQLGLCSAGIQKDRKGYSLVGRDTEAGNGGNRVEEVGDGRLVSGEGHVADEEGVGLGADGVAVLGSAVGGLVLGLVAGILASEVETHLTALKKSTALGIISLLRLLVGGKVDVAETARAAGLTVSDDASALGTLAVLELSQKDGIIDTPAEVTNPEGALVVGNLLGLGLLGSLLLLGGLLSLALLGRLLGLGLLLRLGRVRVGIGVVRVALLLIVGLNTCGLANVYSKNGKLCYTHALLLLLLDGGLLLLGLGVVRVRVGRLSLLGLLLGGRSVGHLLIGRLLVAGLLLGRLRLGLLLGRGLLLLGLLGGLLSLGGLDGLSSLDGLGLGDLGGLGGLDGILLAHDSG